jgi:hypothetical protein
MTLMDESVWRGKIYSVGEDLGTGRDAPVIEPATASGTGTRFGGPLTWKRSRTPAG